jgi:outer membrane lipoprotein-sorting protein
VDEKGHKRIQADYVIDVIRNDGNDSWLSRKIVFSRIDLLPHRQLIYDQSGTQVTDAHYSDYKDYNGLNFPSRIDIKRPEEEYDITLTIVKLDLNPSLADDKFVLDQPAGAQVIRLDGTKPATHGGGVD